MGLYFPSCGICVKKWRFGFDVFFKTKENHVGAKGTEEM
jgi:hypothetical protein